MPEAPVVTSRRERKKHATHESIVDAALDLFMTQGYSATTVAQIAESADVSESTFFNHFPAKEELILAGIDSKAEQLVALLAERHTDTSTADVLTEYLGAIGSRAHDLRRMRVMLRGAISVEPELLEIIIGRWSVTARPALLSSFAIDLGESTRGLRPSILTAVAMGLSNHLAYTVYAQGVDEEHIQRSVRRTGETLARNYREIRAMTW
jgi:AcrR family transcriptional regulator